MFTTLLDFLKEFKEWTPKVRIYIVFSLLTAGIGYFYVNTFLDSKEDIKQLKIDHSEEIKELRLEHNEELSEQRKKFQDEIDEYVLNYIRERSNILEEMRKEADINREEILRLRKEIKTIKDEIR